MTLVQREILQNRQEQLEPLLNELPTDTIEKGRDSLTFIVNK
jgi:hypothetical protein|eukprot:COSAG01_NODE_1627_length_9684_cov_16.787063_7_plen_42_part_00